MANKFYCLVLLSLWPACAYPRLGETQEQCQKRYGVCVDNFFGQHRVYEKGGVRTTVVSSKATGLAHTVVFDFCSSTLPVDRKLVEQILSANHQGWIKAGDDTEEHMHYTTPWREGRGTPPLDAKFDVFGRTLVIIDLVQRGMDVEAGPVRLGRTDEKAKEDGAKARRSALMAVLGNPE